MNKPALFAECLSRGLVSDSDRTKYEHSRMGYNKEKLIELLLHDTGENLTVRINNLHDTNINIFY
jgi:hypothetical protein